MGHAGLPQILHRTPQQRVSSLHWNTDMPITSLGIVLDYMENYVMTRRSPDRYTADHYAYIVFIIIRPEIDAALRRSEVCRERAASAAPANSRPWKATMRR